MGCHRRGGAAGRAARRAPQARGARFPRRNRPGPVSLVDPSEDGFTDDEPDLVGELDADGEILGPEEAAMRIVDEPPGANYDPDPGYVDDERR